MLEEFMQALTRIRGLKKDQSLQEARDLTEEEFKRITGLDSDTLLRLSETELMARLIQSDAGQGVREKMLFLTTLLKETGDVAVSQDRLEDGCACYLKGLNLLLNSLARNEIYEVPGFVPKVEEFLAALEDSELPVTTNVLLMEHYERTGQFAKAEDALYSILEEEPGSLPVVDFGISFYERLQRQSDFRLEEGNLPRPEVEAGLKELNGRKATA
jgi:hypothetical protein